MAAAEPVSQPRTASVLVSDGSMAALEIGIVAEVLGSSSPDPCVAWYELTMCAERPGSACIPGGASLHTPHGLDALATAQTVIIPSVADPAIEASAELIAVLRLAHQRGARVVSICTGAFALAAAGLLDGRRATTHWRYAELLRRRYPRVEVDPNPLYVDEGDVLTGAGCSAALDLCLHIVREDFGAAVANTLARRLVVPPHRDGGQAQYIQAPVTRRNQENGITQSLAWALEHLGDRITIETLARTAHMSPRTYLRHFSRAMGTSPIRWLVAQRVQASLPLLETTDASIEEIADSVGFGAAVTYRHHFAQAMETSPTAYRRAFRTSDVSRRTCFTARPALACC